MGSKLFPSKNRKTIILNSQSIRMLQTLVNKDIYNKYCHIYIYIYIYIFFFYGPSGIRTHDLGNTA